MRVRQPTKFRKIGAGAVSKTESIKTYYPQRGFNVESDVVVPLITALVVGVLFALLFTIGITWRLPDLDWWLVLPVLFLTLTGLTFVHGVLSARETCWQIKETPVEPEPEEPEPAPVEERAIVVRAPNTRSLFEQESEPAIVEQPDVVDDALEDFRLFVSMATVSTAARRMQRKFGRKRANAMRQALMDADLATWNGEPNGTAGWRLSHEEDVVQEALCRIGLPGST